MKILLITLLLLLPVVTFAQQNQNLETERYLKKSISNRKTGNVFMITGGGLIVAGLIVGSIDDKSNAFISGNAIIGSGLIVIGIISGITAIPFYIASNHNKKKYLRITPTAAILPVITGTENTNHAMIGLEFTF